MHLNIQKISVDLKYYDAPIHRTSKVMLMSNRIYMYVCVCLWGQVSRSAQSERTKSLRHSYQVRASIKSVQRSSDTTAKHIHGHVDNKCNHNHW